MKMWLGFLHWLRIIYPYSLVAHFVDTVLDVSIGSSSADLRGELATFRDVDITNIKDVLAFKEKDLFCSKEILLK